MKKLLLILLALSLTGSLQAQQTEEKGFPSKLSVIVASDLSLLNLHHGLNLRLNQTLPYPYLRYFFSYSFFPSKQVVFANREEQYKASETEFGLQVAILSGKRLNWYATGGVSLTSTKTRRTRPDPDNTPGSGPVTETFNRLLSTFIIGSGVDFHLSRRLGAFIDTSVVWEFTVKITSGLRFNIFKLNYRESSGAYD